VIDTGARGAITSSVNRVAVAVLIAVVAGFLLVVTSSATEYPDAWMRSDWLIGYQGGFVRRGLAGSFIYLLADTTGLDPDIAIAFLGIGGFFALVLIFARQIWRLAGRLDGLTVGLLLFLPSLVLFPVWASNALGRKDVLIVLLTAGHLAILRSTLGRDASASSAYVRRSAVLFGIFGVALVLTHEATLFLALPLNVLIALRATRRLSSVTAIFAPTLVAGVATIFSRGSQAAANAICNAWEALDELRCFAGESPSIEALGWSPSQYMESADLTFASVTRLALWMVVIGLTLVLLLVASHRVAKSFTGDAGNASRLAGVVFMRYLLLPLFAATPLFILAIDWGRWWWTISMGYALALTTPALLRLEAEKVGGDPASSRFHALATRGSGPTYLVLVGVVALTVVLVRVPHCCPGVRSVIPVLGWLFP
jgi:hypothetical protein